MRLTARCVELLRLLRGARWLTTEQIHRRFFPRATPDAARKRLRKLMLGRYVLAFRRDRMSLAMFTLGPEGKRVLEAMDGDAVTLEHKPPIQLEHFTAINDLRIAAEAVDGLDYFYAAWELPSVGWKHSVIPDGLVAFGSMAFAIEFDRGVEGVKFFVRTKVQTYMRGFDDYPLAALLVVTDRSTRMMALAKAIGDQQGRVLFTNLEHIRKQGFLAPVFFAVPDKFNISLADGSLFSDSLDDEREKFH